MNYDGKTKVTKKSPFYKWLESKSKKTSEVKIGVLSAEFGKGHNGAEGTATVGDIAIIHEFGTDRIPERSFIRKAAIEFELEWRKFAKLYITKFISGQIDERTLYGIMGLKIQSDIKKRMTEGLEPPLSPVTIEIRRQKRGVASTKPLIDTAQLLNSIDFQVIIR
jgi:hypothetical protein